MSPLPWRNPVYASSVETLHKYEQQLFFLSYRLYIVSISLSRYSPGTKLYIPVPGLPWKTALNRSLLTLAFCWRQISILDLIARNLFFTSSRATSFIKLSITSTGLGGSPPFSPLCACSSCSSSSTFCSAHSFSAAEIRGCNGLGTCCISETWLGLSEGLEAGLEGSGARGAVSIVEELVDIERETGGLSGGKSGEEPGFTMTVEACRLNKSEELWRRLCGLAQFRKRWNNILYRWLIAYLMSRVIFELLCE